MHKRQQPPLSRERNSYLDHVRLIAIFRNGFPILILDKSI